MLMRQSVCGGHDKSAIADVTTGSEIRHTQPCCGNTLMLLMILVAQCADDFFHFYPELFDCLNNLL